MDERLAEAHRKNLVESKDGTLIAYEVVGDGPGLILVPGVMAVAQNYAALADVLSSSFTVYTIERRGRGISGPQGDSYSLQKEVEDVLALQQSTQASYLFGHSYGGLIALETLVAGSFEKLAVYEPGVSINHSLNTDWLGRYEAYLNQGKLLSAFALMTRAGGPKAARLIPMALMKLVLQLSFSREKLHQFFALLPANLREQQQIRLSNTTYRRYEAITRPVLLLRGKATKLPWAKKAIAALLRVLPHAACKAFEKLDHFGPQKNAATLAEPLVRFFLQT